MEFNLIKSIEILERTPTALHHLLDGISEEWTSNNEGGESWTVFDVIGHLIHGDKTDWMLRTDIILSDRADRAFESFDRFAQFEASKGKTLRALLGEFTAIRRSNIEKLRQLNISNDDLNKTGIHPSFGVVTLAQLLSTWTVHDLDHLSQISRIMAKQYTKQTGPWVAYLKILNQ